MTKKSDDDLIGFRDFLDGDDKVSKKNPTTLRNQNDFELVTFLEQDSTRLSNHIDTFEEKVYVMKNYPQDPTLNVEAEHELIQSRVEAINLCLRPDAPIYRNLSEIFNRFFSF